ncbi:uncharacterized protein LTR77_003669 [Saxophila tyrrhenica]|uniref:NAD-dependent epimerase/dehydratase domain-containing protein n=1 Tax=Saxophila tyrrhenica TaxID=1690608 RepID=A0AAV9PIA5_9PEZI|nr:hypothetical protein LTR77_003669 [Saxophila tyrrhenica]
MGSAQRLILITGGSGYIGAHTVDSFLRHGYRVRLAGRSESSCQQMLATHSEHRKLIDTTVVPDITALGAFDSAVQGVDGVVHLASPFFHGFKDVEKDILLPAINGTTEILESIKKHAPQVRRTVITSSIAAILDLSKGIRPGHIYNESQWNPITHESAIQNPAVAYAASKKLAEEAAWNFIETEKPNFSLATLQPMMVYGPPFPGSTSISNLGTSANDIYVLMNGSLTQAPTTRLPVYVDVRDVAEAHRLAYETEGAGRFALCAGNFTKGQVCRLLRESGLGLENRVPSEGLDAENDLQSYSVDSSKA